MAATVSSRCASLKMLTYDITVSLFSESAGLRAIVLSKFSRNLFWFLNGFLLFIGLSYFIFLNVFNQFPSIKPFLQ